MKNSLIILAMVLIPSLVLAAPFLVCDPQTGVDYYVITGLPSPLDGSHVLFDSTYGFKFDLASLPVGSYTVTAKACTNVWSCSGDSSPFSFTRPAALTTPANIRLQP